MAAGGDDEQDAEVSASRPRLAPGTEIGDSYVVEDFVGAGAFGDVYRVRHRFLGRQALKLIEAGAGTAPVDQLLEEARMLASLSHPHIVRLFDADVCDTNLGPFPYFTMEYVVGGTLRATMRERGRFPVPEALAAVIQILDALAAAHGLSPPLLHRDVSPRNVLVASGEPLFLKLSDFGLAQYVDPAVRLVRAAGKIEYQPPEAAWYFASETSDLYAVGLILYELLTGVPAFPAPREELDRGSASSVAAALVRLRERPPEPPSRWRPEVPQELDELVLAVLAREPSERLDSAEEFAAATRRLLAAADSPS